MHKRSKNNPHPRASGTRAPGALIEVALGLVDFLSSLLISNALPFDFRVFFNARHLDAHLISKCIPVDSHLIPNAFPETAHMIRIAFHFGSTFEFLCIAL